MTTVSRPEKLAELQMAFAAHIRNPDVVPAPEGIEHRRMQIYRDLFFNNISKFLAGNFPVLRQLYDNEAWHELVREFYVEHRAQTPLFPELPKEFLRYVQEQRQQRAGDPPFLHELAHYEWIELALSQDQCELETVAVEQDGNLLNGVPLLSPLAWPLSYHYPVHRINPDYQPETPPENVTHLLVYRNRADQVKFMKLNDVTQLLLALMQEHPEFTGLQLLELLARNIGHPEPSSLVEYGHELLKDLRSRDVLLGTRPDAAIP